MMEAKRHPLHEAAIESLGSRLDYGAEILWEEFEEACGERRQSETDHGWEFRQVFLKFCDALMEKGLKVSQRGMNAKGFRLLLREEMAECVIDEAKAQANKNLKNSIMLTTVPRQGLSDQDSKKLDHAAVKSAYLGGIMKRMIMMRKLPATPDMARRIAQKAEIPRDE